MDFNLTVLKRVSQPRKEFDQVALRAYLDAAASFLVVDTCVNNKQENTEETRLIQWGLGFERVMDIVTMLHAGADLEVETVKSVSNACTECWAVSSTLKNNTHIQDRILGFAGRLRRLLDERSDQLHYYKGQRISFQF